MLSCYGSSLAHDFALRIQVLDTMNGEEEIE